MNISRTSERLKGLEIPKALWILHTDNEKDLIFISLHLQWYVCAGHFFIVCLNLWANTGSYGEKNNPGTPGVSIFCGLNLKT